jgi:peptidoglycan hydrolase FlgJ
MAPVAPPGAAPARLPAAPDAAEAAAHAFEAVFLGQMAKLMMETAETGGDFSGGHGEQMFRGVLAERIGEAIGRKGGIGLAPAVLDQIIRMQGGAADGR